VPECCRCVWAAACRAGRRRGTAAVGTARRSPTCLAAGRDAVRSLATSGRTRPSPDHDRCTAHSPSPCTLNNTDTRLTALCPGLPGSAGTRKVKPIWILLKQETMSSSGISLAISKSASRSRQITMPAPTTQVFLQTGCPSCRPTNSVKALKA